MKEEDSSAMHAAHAAIPIHAREENERKDHMQQKTTSTEGKQRAQMCERMHEVGVHKRESGGSRGSYNRRG